MIGRIGKFGVLLFAVIVAAVCVPAQAVILTNGATTLIDDGFESYGVGAAPGNPWFSAIGASNADDGGIVGEAGNPADGPGPVEGDQYLRLLNGTAPNGTVTSESRFFDAQNSGTLHLSFMANTGPGGTQWGFLLLGNGTDNLQLDFIGTPVTWFVEGNAGVVAWQGSEGGGNLLTTDWGVDVWKRVDVEYEIGATEATLAVDGGTPVPFLPVNGGTITGINQLHFANSSPPGQEFNIDRVPEPATMALLSLGGLALLRRRKT